VDSVDIRSAIEQLFHHRVRGAHYRTMQRRAANAIAAL